jgi:hypothetical protein
MSPLRASPLPPAFYKITKKHDKTVNKLLATLQEGKALPLATDLMQARHAVRCTRPLRRPHATHPCVMSACGALHLRCPCLRPCILARHALLSTQRHAVFVHPIAARCAAGMVTASSRCDLSYCGPAVVGGCACGQRFMADLESQPFLRILTNESPLEERVVDQPQLARAYKAQLQKDVGKVRGKGCA